jgi:hypothetical protein
MAADNLFTSDLNPSFDKEVSTEVILEGLRIYTTIKEFGFAYFTLDIIRFN